MKVAVSIGDVAGIGPEVVLKALRRPLGEGVDVYVFGDYGALQREADLLSRAAETDRGAEGGAVKSEGGGLDRAPRGWSDTDWLVPVASVEESVGDAVGVIDVAPDLDASDITKGAGDERCARLQKEAFDAAVEATRAEQTQAVVTAPWNKSLFESIGEPVLGHTDVLDDLFPTSRAEMMLAGPRLRVSLVTTHLPLRRVSDRLTAGRVRTVVRTTVGGLRRRFGIEQPTVAVCALNPHAGEGGAMGGEEERILEPTVSEVRGEFDESVELLGPLPADTLFAGYREGGAPHDAVVCMYHDQGLIPLKLAHFGHSANVTLGLPIIRTSVDHGTAYDIAGRGQADPGSMRYALELAAAMVRRG